MREDLAALVTVLLRRVDNDLVDELRRRAIFADIKDVGRIFHLTVFGMGIPEFAVEMSTREDELGEEARLVWHKASDECRQLFTLLARFLLQIAPDTRYATQASDVQSIFRNRT